jgi:hypothetical protein
MQSGGVQTFPIFISHLTFFIGHFLDLISWRFVLIRGSFAFLRNEGRSTKSQER